MLKDEDGLRIDGSPSHALQIANGWTLKYPGRSFHLAFIEKEHAAKLKRRLQESQAPTSGVTWEVFSADSSELSQKIVKQLRSRSRVVPTLFFVDPYGYPLPVPVLKEMLAIPKAEVPVNLMWYRIRMGLQNSLQQPLVDRMFGHRLWREQGFMRMSRMDQEEAFLAYFQKEVGAAFHLPFPMTFSPEDKVPSPEKRNKYYLIHFASHVSAPLAMKDVMFSAEGRLKDLRPVKPQMSLFGRDEAADRLKVLKSLLCDKFPRGSVVRVSDIRAHTWDERPESSSLPYAQSEYRRALHQMEDEGKVKAYPKAGDEKSFNSRTIHFL
jgi:three-Cys-motif partner protein